MAGELVLITGATGHVGFNVLLKALQKGYRVRATTRREAQGTMLKTHELVKPFAAQLETALVPDITAEGAFDGVLDGVVYVEHIASPIPMDSEDLENDVIRPAVEGTTSILRSALRFPSIRRFVITCSVAGVLPIQVLAFGDAENTYNAHSRVRPLPSGPYDNKDVAYPASKALALDAVDRFIENEHPHFSIIKLMPSVILGPNLLDTKSKQLVTGYSSTAQVLPIVLTDGEIEGGLPLQVVGVSDVARVHVEALDEVKVPGSAEFGLSANIPSFDVVRNWALEAYPEAVKKGIFKKGGHKAGSWSDFDAKETEEVFGKLDSAKADAIALFGQYLGFLEKESA